MIIFDQLKRDDPQLRLLTATVIVGLALLFGGLWYVQIIASKRYKEDQRAQSFRTVRVPSVRGKILDRNGQPLAVNRPSYNVSLYLSELRDHFRNEYTNRVVKEYRAQNPQVKRMSRTARVELEKQARYRVVSNTVQRISATLQRPLAVDERRFHQHYEQRLALPLPILADLAPDQIARFMEHPQNLVGADLEMLPARTYPRGSFASHLLGYLTRDESSAQDEESFFNYRLPDYRGVTGIEGSFDSFLRGKAGVKSVLVNNLGYRQMEIVEAPAEPGRNVVLTIDATLQEAAESALRSTGAAVRGAVIVMDPNTGDLLAMASAPEFDPNDFVPRISHEKWAQLNHPQALPMINRATYGMYAPGSIFKIVTGLAALETGALNPQQHLTVEPDPSRPERGAYFVGKRKIEDTAPPGDYDFVRGFKRSSNTYFIHFGLKPGVLERMIALGSRLHLGERTAVLPRQELAGDFPTPRDIAAGWHPGDTANLAIGQGMIAVTPVQMAVMTSAIANGGKVFWPRLALRIEDQDPISPVPPTVFPAARLRDDLGVKPAHLQLIRKAMLADVEDAEDSTGREAYVKGMDICGKTGTAQVTMGRRVVDHITWFVSFAPFAQPRHVVVVMVQSGDSGGGTCAPIARRIYQAIQAADNRRTAVANSLALAR